MALAVTRFQLHATQVIFLACDMYQDCSNYVSLATLNLNESFLFLFCFFNTCFQFITTQHRNEIKAPFKFVILNLIRCPPPPHTHNLLNHCLVYSELVFPFDFVLITIAFFCVKVSFKNEIRKYRSLLRTLSVKWHVQHFY